MCVCVCVCRPMYVCMCLCSFERHDTSTIKLNPWPHSWYPVITPDGHPSPMTPGHGRLPEVLLSIRIRSYHIDIMRLYLLLVVILLHSN